MSSLGLKPLKLNEALRLYDLIGRFIPEQTLDEQIIEFVGKIVDNIVEDDPTVYADVICLMAKINVDELAEYPPDFRLELFITGLTVNDIIGLKKFCKEIHYAG